MSIALNLSEWIAEKPLGESSSRYGKMLEVGVAFEIKSYIWENLLKADNYDWSLYMTKGFAAESQAGASGADIGIGVNVSYIAENATMSEFTGNAIEHVGAVLFYGMSEIETATGKHGWSLSNTAGTGIGSFMFDTETKTDLGSLREYWNYYRGLDNVVETRQSE